MQFVKGVEVPFPRKIVESYTMKRCRIRSNVGADKIEDLLTRFVKTRRKRYLFSLLLPVDVNVEKDVGRFESPRYRDTYLADDLTQKQALAFLERGGDALLNDGLVSLEFSIPETGDGIVFGKYNVVEITSPNLRRYEPIMIDLGIPYVEKLVTAWDVFSPSRPGISRLYDVDGRNVFTLVEEFKKIGLHWVARDEV